MGGDGLYDPLGQPGPARSIGVSRSSRLLIGVVAAVGAVAVAAFAIWTAGHGGSDHVVASAPVTAPPPEKPIAPAPPPPASTPAPVVVTLTGRDAERQSGVTVVRPPGTSAPPGTFIPVPQPDPLALPPAPDPRLVEPSRYGILPRRGADGSRPADVYARPAGPDADAGKPRIALFVGGMGLNAALTSAAARALPPAVTLGFAPYGGDLAEQVARVRALGHEAVLQVPMESYDVPDGANMPRLLATGASPRDTLDALHWQMSRFVGYVGVSSFLGAKFTADAGAFTPVLKDLAERGLFYLDDGTAARNLAATAGPPLGLPVVKADVAIDALGDPEAVEAALTKLEKLARSKGVAVGATTGLPNAVDSVAAFANGLAARGLVLVPVSSLAGAPSPLPTRR